MKVLVFFLENVIPINRRMDVKLSENECMASAKIAILPVNL